MSARLAVRVTPKASKDEVVGWREGELLVRVSAAPEGGKANAAVCRLLAKRLGVSRSRVRILSGTTSRHKVLEIVGVVESRFAEVFPEEP